MGASRPADATRWPLILLVMGAGVVSAFQVGKAPTALAAVQADLGLNLATASWLLSAFAIIGAVAGIGIGVAADHTWGWPSVSLLIAAIVAAAGLLVFVLRSRPAEATPSPQ